MNATGPLVSIGLPVYNGAQHIGQTLNSLLSQDYENIEIIVSDNCSTDGTSEICEEFAAKHSLIRYSRLPENIGAPANFSRVFDLSTGNYFMWASDHDEWTPGLIRKAVEVLESNPEIALASAQPSWIFEDGSVQDIPGAVIDTRQYFYKSWRLMMVMWALAGCYETYGVYRRELMKQLLPAPRVFGWDIIFLTNLASLGHFAPIPGERFYARRNADFGNFAVGLAKIGLKPKKWSPVTWFATFILHKVKFAVRQFENPIERMMVAVGILHCDLWRYRWIPGVVHAEFKRAEAEKTVASGRTVSQAHRQVVGINK